MAGGMNKDDEVIVNSDSTLVSLGGARAAAFQDGFWYMASKLLAPKVKFPGFKGTIATIWRVRSGLTIQDAGERFVFQFNSEAVRNRILHGGPWFYHNTMSRKEVVKFSSMQVVPLGRKRKAVPKLDRFGKKYLAFPDSILEVEDNVSLVLQQKHGKIWVSPKKKKVGHPKGSKNRVKSAVEQDDKTIRKYKRRGKALCFDSNLEDNVHVKVGKPVTVLEETNVTTPALELAAVEVPVECETSHSTTILV